MKAFYTSGSVELYQADVLEWALDYRKKIDAGTARPCHAILTDPPYGLGEPPPIDELLKAWLNDEHYDTGHGFMSAKWDVVPGPSFWRALLDICHFGAYLFCFGGTRTVDLLSIACRLGGWERFDEISCFYWVQGQGMKKGVDVSKQLDAAQGVEREVVGFYQFPPDHARPNKDMERWAQRLNEASERSDGQCAFLNGNKEVTAPATPLAALWDGYHTGLAPKHEPILLFRKTRGGRTFAQCAREFGSGGLWVDGCRVKTDLDAEPDTGSAYYAKRTMKYPTDNSDGSGGSGATFVRAAHDRSLSSAGRWPPNTHFCHRPPTAICPACEGEGCDDCHGVGAVGGCVRVGSKRVKTGTAVHRHGVKATWGTYGAFEPGASDSGYADPDGTERVDAWQCDESCAARALDEMAGETGGHPGTYRRPKPDGRVGNVYGGFGHPESGKILNTYKERSSNASRFYPCHDWSLDIAERLAGEVPFKYCPKAGPERDCGMAQYLPRTKDLRKRYRQDKDGSWLARAKCKHETMKPLSLGIWLAKLLLPPAEYDPILCVPFSGASSEMVSAMLAGWQHIVGVEREMRYCIYGKARLQWWRKWAANTGKDDPAAIRRLAQAAEVREQAARDEGQLSMFELIEE